MPTLPNSLADLFDPPDFETLCPHWAGTFAARRQFRLKNYNEFTSSKSIPRLGKIEFSSLFSAARDAIPDTWKNCWRNGDWDNLRYEQYICAGEAPLRFDKACLVLALSAVQADSAQLPDSICDYVKICPAVFAVDGFDRNFYNKHVRNDPDFYRALAIAGGGQNGSFFGQILDGHLMTHQTAVGLEQKLISEKIATGVYAYRHDDPSKLRKVPKPASSERLVARPRRS